MASCSSRLVGLSMQVGRRASDIEATHGECLGCEFFRVHLGSHGMALAPVPAIVDVPIPPPFEIDARAGIHRGQLSLASGGGRHLSIACETNHWIGPLNPARQLGVEYPAGMTTGARSKPYDGGLLSCIFQPAHQPSGPGFGCYWSSSTTRLAVGDGSACLRSGDSVPSFGRLVTHGSGVVGVRRFRLPGRLATYRAIARVRVGTAREQPAIGRRNIRRNRGARPSGGEQLRSRE